MFFVIDVFDSRNTWYYTGVYGVWYQVYGSALLCPDVVRTVCIFVQDPRKPLIFPDRVVPYYSAVFFLSSSISI